MTRTIFWRSLVLVVTLIAAFIFWYLFANGRGLWDKIAALEAGVFSLTALAYIWLDSDNRTELGRQVPIKSWLGCFGGLSYLCISVGMTLFYLQRYAGLHLVDMTIAFSLLFFVPMVTLLVYVLTLVVARFRPYADTGSPL